MHIWDGDTCKVLVQAEPKDTLKKLLCKPFLFYFSIFNSLFVIIKYIYIYMCVNNKIFYINNWLDMINKRT